MRGLFNRLDRGARELDEARSIAAHLRALFGARAGSAASAPELGRPDLTDLVHTWPVGVRAVERALEALVVRYEPRLAEVRIRAVTGDDPLALAFQIRARAATDPTRAYRFVTEIDALGRCTIR